MRIRGRAWLAISARVSGALHAGVALASHRLIAPETSKRLVRLFYSTILKAAPAPTAAVVQQRRLAPVPLGQGTLGIDTKWDADTVTWAKSVFEGSLRSPFPANDPAESASDTFRMRGILGLLAEHYSETRCQDSLERLGLLVAKTARLGDRNKAWAWDTTNAALRLLSMLRANEVLRDAGTQLPGWTEWCRNYVIAHEAALNLGKRVEPPGNHEALNFAGRLALHYLLRPDDPMPATARVEMTGILEAQFLGDGGHVERAPHYHLQVTALIDFLLQTDARRGGPPMAATRQLLERARGALQVLISPERTPVPFGDVGRTWSGMESAREVRALGLDSLGPPRNSLETEFGVARREWNARGHAIAMWVDVGPVGYERNSGHGHADALSFTLYVDGRPLVVDPGTLDYSARPESLWHRLPEAHNSVYWPDSPAYRLRGVYRWTRHPPRPQLLPPADGHVAGVAARQEWTIAQKEFAHRRELIPNPSGLTIVDDVYSASDNRAIVRLGFAPKLGLTLGSQVVARHECADVQISVTGEAVSHLRLVDSRYSPRYGVGVDAQALEAHCRVSGWNRIVTELNVMDGNASSA